MNVAVIGLGKIGLPLAVQFADKGKRVFGVDVNDAVVAAVNSGIEPFPGEAQLQEKLSAAVARGNLTATSDYAEAIPFADVVIVVVPLFVDDDARPDFGWMDSATQSLAPYLRKGALVIYETTLPVGTTRGRWKPMIESGSGLAEGADFHLVFSPERVLTGRVFADLRKYPKLVGGLSAEGSRLARAFYEEVLEFDARSDLSRPNGVWDLGTAEASELAKLAETTYRDVNIGLANEFARFADSTGIDIYKVIEACNSQPYSHIHTPGIAVGGHCIPVYPRLYLWNDPEATIVRAARQRNASMPSYAVSMVETSLGTLEDKSVVVLGAAYRGGVKETAFSGVFATVKELVAAGATVTVHDPLYTNAELQALGFDAYSVGDGADAVILQADHAEYLAWGELEVPRARVILDGRHILKAIAWPEATYIAIGATATE